MTRVRRAPKDVFVGVRISSSLDKLIGIRASTKTKSAFIRTAIERYILCLAELDTV